MAGNAVQAGGSLKTKKPQCGNTEASVNEINFGEEIVMGNHSTNVIPFNFGKQLVRTLLTDDQPWFVATDVCESLAIVNTARALSRLDDDERGIHSMNTPGGKQNLSVVNESGLYSLILTSRKTEAKRFKKWVTAEVLPAIRKQGRYEDSKGVMTPMVDDLLGKSGAMRLSNVMRCRVAKLDTEHQRSATAKLASAVHACFGVSRIELIPSSQFEAAANFVASYAIEGEYLAKEDAKPALSIHYPIEALAARREGMLIVRNAEQAWLDVTMHDLRDIRGDSTPLEKLLWELEEAGFDIRGAWWELRTYRNKLREFASFVTGMGRVADEPQRYAVTPPKSKVAA